MHPEMGRHAVGEEPLFVEKVRHIVGLDLDPRYRFATWRWVLVLASLLLPGGSLRWLVPCGIKTVI